MYEDFLLQPLETPPAYSAVVDRVRRAIALGAVLPGDRLPTERALAAGMQVSRVTIREAMRVLQGEGLVVTKRGSSGSMVAPSVARLQIGDDKESLREVFELRLAVETMTARLAADRGAPADIERLDACQNALKSSTDVHAFRQADSEFHLLVAHMSGNNMLQQAVEDARASVFSELDRHEFALIYESSIRGHSAVIEAIRKREPAAAAAAMAAHIEEGCDEVISVLSEDCSVQDHAS